MIEAPDGSAATYDAERTRQAYAEPAIADNCDCAGCRNYRAAWKPAVFPSDLLAACAEIGIDPAKAFETTALDFKDGVVLYNGRLPFYGIASNEPMAGDVKVGDLKNHAWIFSSHPFGTATLLGSRATVEFCVYLPWVLSEPYA
jgi:hypothetical protein